MIDYIIGIINSVTEDSFIIESNNIGYRVNTSTNTISRLITKLDSQKIFTNLVVREDGFFLYGFDNTQELEMFKLLQTVSKVGPKLACTMLSSHTPSKLGYAIYKNDLDTLCKIPGIGRKTAERLVLELKDKVKQSITDLENTKGDINTSSAKEEAIEALCALGFSRFEVDRVLISIDYVELSVEDIIKEVLKRIKK